MRTYTHTHTFAEENQVPPDKQNTYKWAEPSVIILLHYIKSTKHIVKRYCNTKDCLCTSDKNFDINIQKKFMRIWQWNFIIATFRIWNIVAYLNIALHCPWCHILGQMELNRNWDIGLGNKATVPPGLKEKHSRKNLVIIILPNLTIIPQAQNVRQSTEVLISEVSFSNLQQKIHILLCISEYAN